MNTPRLGCLSPLALITASIMLVILFAAEIISGNSMFNPGELNAQAGTSIGGLKSHAEIGKQCGKCHAAFWSDQNMSVLCLECHANIQAEIADPTSMHGILLQGTTQTCQTCHTEHHGPDGSLTLMDMVNFPHDGTGFSLTGHQLGADGKPFICSDCHFQGISTFDQGTCINCHRALDMGFTVTHTHDFGTSCLTCHDGVDRYGDFDHNQLSFALTGKHLEVECSGCHLDDRTIPDLQDTPTECEACHLSDDAHAGKYGTQCGLCHTPVGWIPAEFDHNLADFKLEGKHVDVPCESCHINGFKGTPNDCYSCHQQDDEHNGAFGTACETCHNPSDWTDAKFDHSLAAFKLTGAHVNVECKACHINNVFKGTPDECAACHAEPDYHLGMFTGQDCSDCHTTTAWSPARFDGQHTFPMDHGEQINTCKDCHQPNLTQWTCYTCHDRAEVESKHIEEGISDFSDCLHCHPTGQEDGGGGDD
jgi:hypothetical protein